MSDDERLSHVPSDYAVRKELWVAYINAITTAATANGISPSAAGLSGPVPHGSSAKLNNG
jgi:hypothetical protein